MESKEIISDCHNISMDAIINITYVQYCNIWSSGPNITATLKSYRAGSAEYTEAHSVDETYNGLYG